MSEFAENAILITGAARSGTSVTANLIYNCGVFGGKLARGDMYNPDGYRENLMIRSEVTRPVLKWLNADHRGQSSFPDDKLCAEKADEYGRTVRHNVERIIVSQGWEEGKWFYKDPKICPAWRVWHAAFPHAKWVFMHRDESSHLDSLMATKFMNAHRTRKDWQTYYLEEHKRILEEITNCADVDLMVIHPDKMMSGDFSEARQMIEWLGLDWSEAQAKETIDPSQWVKV